VSASPFALAIRFAEIARGGGIRVLTKSAEVYSRISKRPAEDLFAPFENRDRLFDFGFDGFDDPASFADGQNLIGFHLREPFDLVRGRPLHFDVVEGARGR